MLLRNKLGFYSLDQNVNELDGIMIFSDKEYKIAKSLGMNPMFAGEQFYNALPVYFASTIWDYTTIGAVNGIVYKLTIQIVGKHVNSSKIYEDTINIINKYYGQYNYTENSFFKKKFIWDNESTNVFLTKRNLGFINGINLIFTSKNVKAFNPVFL